jgi:hypothetical protein
VCVRVCVRVCVCELCVSFFCLCVCELFLYIVYVQGTVRLYEQQQQMSSSKAP